MSRVLLAGFLGDNNSAKIILDKCSKNLKKLYLENDFQKCADQIQSAISCSHYEFVLTIGQKPVIKSICIELVGKYLCSSIQTQYDYNIFSDFFKNYGYKVRISSNAGNYLCNHVYYHSLNTIAKNNSNTKTLFVHIPYLNNISDVNHLALTVSNFLLNL